VLLLLMESEVQVSNEELCLAQKMDHLASSSSGVGERREAAGLQMSVALRSRAR
jgi:hypothetical protein